MGRHKFSGTAPQCDRVDDFVRYIAEQGWKLTITSPGVTCYSRVVVCPRYGRLEYVIRIDGVAAATPIPRKECIHLIGPVTNVFTGKLAAQATLAAWKTVDGAKANIINRFEKEYDEFRKRADKAYQRRVKYDMK